MHFKYHHRGMGSLVCVKGRLLYLIGVNNCKLSPRVSHLCQFGSHPILLETGQWISRFDFLLWQMFKLSSPTSHVSILENSY